ncbi:hypothetical protein LTR37_015659 [Vermiconidia calcicola]|uniref:Uncharacterized protein n=1 Tax=Vermiconidia calcicola TaxID=1690605 RepID=A0ACC3MQC0_9PEZI|nr:hypothetical protein LTR37_015659 [Vermiconidia calcicola]
MSTAVQALFAGRGAVCQVKAEVKLRQLPVAAEAAVPPALALATALPLRDLLQLKLNSGAVESTTQAVRSLSLSHKYIRRFGRQNRSMFGRKVGNSLFRLPIYTRLPLRPSAFQHQYDCTSRAFLVCSQRSYATPGRPRRTVGEPSRPVKRAAKSNASKTKSTEDPATKQVKEKKSTAAKKKPAPKRQAKKELTDEQKAAKDAKIAKAKITDLKKAALSPPSNRGPNAWNEFFAERMKSVNAKEMQGPDRRQKMSQVLQPIVAEWKSLSPADLEHYNHLSHQSTEAVQAEYKRWVESHTVEQIHVANLARAQLRRKLGDKAKGTTRYPHISDQRAVKRPASAFIQFSVNRQASGDFKNIAVTERVKLIAQEWKALNEGEKEKYKNLQNQDRSRYSAEYNDVYGHNPPSMSNDVPRAAAAAA